MDMFRAGFDRVCKSITFEVSFGFGIKSDNEVNPPVRNI